MTADEDAAYDDLFVVLARNDSTSRDDADARALAELQRRAAPARLALRLYPSDRAFRAGLARLRDDGAGFLFVDDDIWRDEPLAVRVQPPPCAPGAAACALALRPARAVRVGNGVFMHTYAPPVARVVGVLDFAPADLRAILAHEQLAPNITEAACRWALGTVDSLFHRIVNNSTKAKATAYFVAVLPCDDDPDRAAHVDAARYLREGVLWHETRVDVHYAFEPVNCSDERALADAVARSARERRTYAAVAWSAAPGARAAAAVAARTGLPLLLVGAAPAPSDAARAPSARLADVARAYRWLLELCGWSRFAVLSDRSAYSRSFAEALLTEREFAHRNYTLDAHGVASALRELRAADARVVVVNAAWPLAEAVLCEARRRGPAARRVWLVREARAPTCAGGWAGLRVLSLGVSWRGGAAARGGSAALREGLRGAAWAAGAALGPPLTAALVDALLQVTLAFDKFLRERPAQRYDLRGSVSDLTRYLDELNVTGVAGNLQSDGFALREPAVYLEQWAGGRGRTVAVWRVARGAVRQEWPAGAPACPAPAPDRPACATARAGDAFAPRCLDAQLFASAAFLLLGALALWAARRARLAHRRRREGAWRRCLEEQRRRAAAALGAFLVERGAIRLLHEIGSGCYGRVHCAELRRPGGATLLVAAKEPRADAAPAEEGALLREAVLLAPLAHAHVVRLVGVCVADGPPTLLLEHACHLDLQRYLAERRARAEAGACRELAPRALTRLARQAAGALRYLAARRLVHRDVRAANCLVDERRALKLADFGLARALGAAEPEYATTRRGLFPVLWMAPESLARGVFSPASDVWALGVLLLELATLGARPYGSWAPAAVLRYVAGGGHAPLPPDLCSDTYVVT
nr:uncharacterized protein LOC117981832 [Maniola hyperantus]